MTKPTIGHCTTTEFMSSEQDCGKPLDCVGLPISVQVGKHDFVKLTPQEAQEKGLLIEDGEIPRAHVRQKYVFANDWTKTKHDVTVPLYTETEAQLLTALRQVRDLLVRTEKNIAAMRISDWKYSHEGVHIDVQKALNITVETLSVHEVPK